jgi:archaellum component FlaF (FlaF/FlaG flagellin family)
MSEETIRTIGAVIMMSCFLSVCGTIIYTAIKSIRDNRRDDDVSFA